MPCSATWIHLAITVGCGAEPLSSCVLGVLMCAGLCSVCSRVVRRGREKVLSQPREKRRLHGPHRGAHGVARQAAKAAGTTINREGRRRRGSRFPALPVLRQEHAKTSPSANAGAGSPPSGGPREFGQPAHSFSDWQSRSWRPRRTLRRWRQASVPSTRGRNTRRRPAASTRPCRA